MKIHSIRMISLLLMAGILLSLVGCGTEPAVSAPSESDSSDISVSTAAPEEQPAGEDTDTQETGGDTTSADTNDSTSSSNTTTQAATAVGGSTSHTTKNLVTGTRTRVTASTTTRPTAHDYNPNLPTMSGTVPTQSVTNVKPTTAPPADDGGANLPTTSGTAPTQSATNVKPTTAPPADDEDETVTKPPVPANSLIRDYIRNVEAWQMKGFLGYEDKDFVYQVQILGKQQYNRGLLSITINKQKLGDTGSPFYASLYTAEWPSHCNYGGGLDGSEPSNRKQATDNVIAWLKSQMATQAFGAYASMDSFTRWQHYTAEAGYDYISCEIGANVNAPQLSVAFTRGAAKQYNEAMGLGGVDAWYVDFSLWNWTGMINYTGDETMHRHDDSFHSNVVNHEYAGQSVSAARRAYYMAYMSGAQWLINEGGAESACYPTLNQAGDSYTLTPHGKMNQEFYAFTQRNPDRGVTMVPFGIVIPRDHGLPYGHWMANDGNYKVFERFVFTEGDWMIDNLFRLLYPNNYPNQNVRDDGKQQVNTPYGDTVDILTDRADEKVLNTYPVIILAGDVDLTPTMRLKYTNYVQNGGTLVLNSAYTKDFPATYRNTGSIGKGKVIVYGDAYKVDGLGAIMDDLLKEQIPFSIDERVQYIVNVNDKGFVLTLINNDGVFKAYDSAETVDKSHTKYVNVTYTGKGTVKAAKDWISGNQLSASKEQTVTLAPGGIAVIEFVVR
ncbi:MAG: hypothetical protein IJO76_00770 [Clostridia bacterium]|nr:hypothetical protein [Clostridia bacterium]